MTKQEVSALVKWLKQMNPVREGQVLTPTIACAINGLCKSPKMQKCTFAIFHEKSRSKVIYAKNRNFNKNIIAIFCDFS